MTVRKAVFEAHDHQICAIAKMSKYTRDFTSHRFFRADIENTYAKGEIGIFCGSGGRVDGFVYVKHLKVKSRPYSVVHYMGVAEKMKGRGIGRKLLDWALETSPHGVVELSCEHSNAEGMTFYPKCGYWSVAQGYYGARPYTRFRKEK